MVDIDPADCGGPYSPEESDTARFGDWQSKAGTMVWIVAAILAAGALG